MTAKGRSVRGDRLVLIVGIIVIAILCIVAEYETREPLLPLKLVAMYMIGLLCGVKGLARFIPLPS